MNTLRPAIFASLWFLPCCTSASSAPHKAYIGLFGDNAVAVVDLATATVLATIPVPAPDGLVITPDGAKVFVSSNNADVVDVIDTAKDAIEASITVGTQPAGLAITPDGRSILVSVQGDGQAAIIDTQTETVSGKVPVAKAHNSAISPDGTAAYVASQVAATPAIDVVGMAGATGGATYALDKSPRAIAALGTELYVTLAGSDAIDVLDAATGTSTASIATGGSPHDIRPTLDGALVLTVSQTAGELEGIDPASRSVTAHVPTGQMPHWIALASDGKLAYVTNEGDNNIVAVDLATTLVTQTIAVGKGPRKIAVQP